MTFVTTQPEIMAAAAGQLTGLGTELNAQNAAAMVPTTGVTPAAGDEVSALTAAQFASHAALGVFLDDIVNNIFRLMRDG